MSATERANGGREWRGVARCCFQITFTRWGLSAAPASESPPESLTEVIGGKSIHVLRVLPVNLVLLRECAFVHRSGCPFNDPSWIGLAVNLTEKILRALPFIPGFQSLPLSPLPNSIARMGGAIAQRISGGAAPQKETS